MIETLNAYLLKALMKADITIKNVNATIKTTHSLQCTCSYQFNIENVSVWYSLNLPFYVGVSTHS